MNEEINQKISQFLDDELATAELDDFMLKIKKQPELKSKISRYQAVAQVMKMDHAVMANANFLDRINQQLKQEPHHLLPVRTLRKPQGHFWQKTSLAIAASVACVAVIMSQQELRQQPGSQIMEQPQQVAIAIKPIAETPVVQVAAKKSQPSQHARLKAYLQAHNDDLYTHGSLNMHPLAQVAGYNQD